MRKNKVIYDAYKPQKAVDNFVCWIKNMIVLHFQRQHHRHLVVNLTSPRSEKNARVLRNINLLQIKKVKKL